MAGYGGGIAKAITAGLTGYRSGVDERERQLIVLAAQKRQAERQERADALDRDKFSHQMEQDRLSNLANGIVQGGAKITPATTPEAGLPTLNQTFDDALNEGMGGKAPEASPLTKPVTPGSLGTVPKNTYDVTPDMVDFGRSKQGQALADRTAEARLRADEAQKDRLELAKMNIDARKEIAGQSNALRRDLQEDRQRDAQEKRATQTKVAATIQKQIATNKGGLSKIDEAIAAVNANPQAVGFFRGRIDALDQRIDPEGVDARASVADIGSQIVHDRSGAAVTVSEYPRLAPFIPSARDSKATVLKKLERMKRILAIETQLLEGAQAPVTAPAAPASHARPTRPDVRRIIDKYGLEP